MIIKDTRQDTLKRAKLFLDNLKGGVYILGTNKYGSNVKKWLDKIEIPVLGFINDYETSVSFSEAPVVKSRQVSANQNIINCVVEGRPIDAHNNIANLNPGKQIDYFSLQLLFPSELSEIDFMHDTDSILNFKSTYLNLYNKLEDTESKETLEKVTLFRLNRNIFELNEFKLRIQEQYFEPFIKFNRPPTFIDGGAFDGSTSLAFAKLYPDFKAIHLFEPNSKILQQAKINLKDFSNVHFYNKGLWSSGTTLNFDDTLSSASKLSNEGKTVIETTSLDETIKEEIDFIKLDIEGAEYEALKGATNLIKECKPRLAVCVYHNQKDFIRIPELIASVRDDYKIYLRHYTQAVFETVMFFI